MTIGGLRVIVLLYKAMNGLRRAPLLWFLELQRTEYEMGGQDTFESTLFRISTKKGFILVLVYVDDLLIASRDEKEGADFLQKLTGIWKIKLTGKIPALKRGVLQFLGRTIYRERDGESSLSLGVSGAYMVGRAYMVGIIDNWHEKLPGKPVVAPGGGSPAKSLTPGTPVEEMVGEKEKARSARGSPKDQAASDPEDDVIGVEERQAKRPKLHKELRFLSLQLGKAVTSTNDTSQAMVTMMEQFKKETDELAQTAMSLGLTGVSNKYYLAAITAFQDELKQCKWQVSGSGKNQINVSLKAVTLGLGDKIIDLHRLGKEWKTEAQGQHRELLEAISALELAITKQRTMAPSENVAVPVVQMYEPQSSMGPGPPPAPPAYLIPLVQRHPPMGEAPLEQNIPAAFQRAHQQGGRLPGYGHMPQFQAQHRRAWLVQIQGQNGITRVRAVSPTPLRQGETPPEEWHQEFALGSVKLSNAHHCILPDSFIQGGVAWPGA